MQKGPKQKVYSFYYSADLPLYWLQPRGEIYQIREVGVAAKRVYYGKSAGLEDVSEQSRLKTER